MVRRLKSTSNYRTGFGLGLGASSNLIIYLTLASLVALVGTALAISFAGSVSVPTFAESVSTDVATAGAYYINITANNTVALSVDSPSVDSTIASVSDTVTVKTNSSSGYQLYLSMATGSTSNALTYNTTVNGNPQTYTLPATTATDTLSNDSWGYSTDNSTWKAVPLSTATQTVSDAVKTTDAANETGDETTIYYGAKITSATVPGTYTGTVMYTALGDAATASTATVATISPSTVEYNTTPSNNRISITTPLFTNMEIVASRVTATIGTSSCTDISLSSPNGQLVVSCTIPELADGTYTATVNISDFNKTYSGEIIYQTTLNSITPEITAVSPTDLSTQQAFTVDTNLNYAKYNSILTNVGTSTIKVNNVNCAGSVTTSNNNGNIRFVCDTSPKNNATSGSTKYATVLTLSDDSNNSKIATTSGSLSTKGVVYTAVDSGSDLAISPNEAIAEETPTVIITTGLALKTGINTNTVTVTIGGSSCTNPSIVANSNPIQVTCTAPVITEIGAKDVVVSIGGHNYTKTTTGIYTVKTAGPQVVTSCSQLATHEKGILDSYMVIKMADGKCWDMTDRSTSIYGTAYISQSVCAGVFSVPDKSAFDNLLGAEGTDGQIYTLWEQENDNGYYYSKTLERLSSDYDGAPKVRYFLLVQSSSAKLTYRYTTDTSYSARLRCYTAD